MSFAVNFKRSRKSDFLTDIQGQLEEDEQIYEIVRKRRSVAKYLAVSFDRALNDSEFSYSDFDLALVALDAVSGGLGITKPVNQMRALRWNSDARGSKNGTYLPRSSKPADPTVQLFDPAFSKATNWQADLGDLPLNFHPA
ncbi:hypothetical protein, partial [Pseudorhizobium marinum]|uniref:hypothetical protein n=1 Tax=Pseudorhizobium marinum TaxID=1496690 RepID=UPI0012DE0102